MAYGQAVALAQIAGRHGVLDQLLADFFHGQPFELVGTGGWRSTRSSAPRRSCLARCAATSTNRNRLVMSGDGSAAASSTASAPCGIVNHGA